MRKKGQDIHELDSIELEWGSEDLATTIHRMKRERPSVRSRPVSVRQGSAVRPGITLGCGTDVGQKRSQNEDYFGYREPGDPELFKKRGRLAVVADGMGGSIDGSTASRLAVDTVLTEYFAADSQVEPNIALRDAIVRANEKIHWVGQAHKNKKGMGTTVSAFVLIGKTGYFGHVGDSRIYLVRKGKILQISEDHNMVSKLLKSGSITKEEARNHAMANVITRCVGRKESVEVDVSGPIEVWQGDRFVLCSDGLHSLIEDNEIAMAVSAVAPSQACKALIEVANERGGYDNITIQIISVDE